MPHTLVIKNKIDSGKNLKVGVFRKDIRKTTPHTHNSYFEIIFLSGGKGNHTIDSNTFSVLPPVIFIVRKEQVHHWDLTGEPDGYVLILKKAFVDESLDKELKILLGEVSSHQAIYLPQSNSLGRIFDLLVEEFRPEKNNNNPVMEGLLKVLLAKIAAYGRTTDSIKKSRPDAFEHFRDLLNSDRTIKNSVSWYANQMNTTPQNLNSICRKATGLSATEVISEFIISEAKRLLIYTDKTVSEISDTMDFRDNSHFVKYFKRHTGQTPGTFRSSL